MLYKFLRFTVSIGIRFYYKEVKIKNQHNLVDSGPCIVIANHPNTLMDAWLMGFIHKRRVFFMAKATFFSSPFKRKILGSLGMIPVNRKSDGAISGVNNKDSFEACYRLLEEGGLLVVFPEGTSYLERQLRELKTGTARIGLEVEKRSQGKIPLKVVPVGLNYLDGDSYRGRVLIDVGTPIDLDKYWENYEKEPIETSKLVTEQFRVGLSRVFVNLDDSHKEKMVEELTELFDTRYSNRMEKASSSVSLMREFSDKLDALTLTEPWKLVEVQERITKLKEDLNANSIQADFLDRTFRRSMFVRQSMQSFLFLLVTIPIFMYGFLHHVIQYRFISFLLPRLTKEVEYHAPIAILLGLFLYPLFYAGFGVLFYQLFEVKWYILISYLISLPLSGIFAHFYMEYVQLVFGKRHFTSFAKKKEQVFKDLKKQREELKQLILN